MSQFYSPKRKYGLYRFDDSKPFRISRSKIELFLQCPRCFYLDRVVGIGRPPGFPFSLNSAVDKLLKKEFDMHRIRQTAHPLMAAYGLQAVPFLHEKMDEWRDSFKRGITYLHKPTNLVVTGGVDDVWIGQKNELIIVDYKSTSKDGEINLDAEWQDSYKRQAEIYQWLFRQNGFSVSNTAYFVYCNGKADKKAFDGRLEFEVKLISYLGSTSWVEQTITDIHSCLNSEEVPKPDKNCDYCQYVEEVKKVSEII